jgi:hypothetical protein
VADTNRLTMDLDPTVEYPIHCCVCLNGSQGRVPAVAMVKGYAACDQHVGEIRKPDFDFTTLLQFGKRNRTL